MLGDLEDAGLLKQASKLFRLLIRPEAGQKERNAVGEWLHRRGHPCMVEVACAGEKRRVAVSLVICVMTSCHAVRAKTTTDLKPSKHVKSIHDGYGLKGAREAPELSRRPGKSVRYKWTC